MKCSGNFAWPRWWFAWDHRSESWDDVSNVNAQCTCACGTRADGSPGWSAVAVGDEMTGSSLLENEQDSSAACSETAADCLAGTRLLVSWVLTGLS